MENMLPGGVEPLWSLKDLMQYLGCSEDMARRMIRERHLPCLRFSQKKNSPLRFRGELVRDWVMRNEEPVQPEALVK